MANTRPNFTQTEIDGIRTYENIGEAVYYCSEMNQSYLYLEYKNKSVIPKDGKKGDIHVENEIKKLDNIEDVKNMRLVFTDNCYMYIYLRTDKKLAYYMVEGD
jgi:hypothetical protein